MNTYADQVSHLFGSLLGATIVACVLGGITAKIALRNGQPGYAFFSFFACFGMGMMSGLRGGVPVLILCVIFSWMLEKLSGQGHRPRSEKKSIGGKGFIFGIVFGLSGIVIASAVGVFIYEKRAPDEPFWDASVRMVKEMTVGVVTDSKSERRVPISETKMRAFQSSDGRVITARLISFDGETVEIIREDGQPFSSSISLFSEKDQNYIRSSF